MPRGNHNPWSAHEDTLIQALYLHRTAAFISAHLPGRSAASIRIRAARLGLVKRPKRYANNKKPEVKEDRRQRRCLGCSNEFLSTHIGHRVCNSCKTTAAWRGATLA